MKNRDEKKRNKKRGNTGCCCCCGWLLAGSCGTAESSGLRGRMRSRRLPEVSRRGIALAASNSFSCSFAAASSAFAAASTFTPVGVWLSAVGSKGLGDRGLSLARDETTPPTFRTAQMAYRSANSERRKTRKDE